MWKLGRLLHFQEHWQQLLCHNEHVDHLNSLLALVHLHRLSNCLDGWCLVLLHNWDIKDHDVLDQRDWCLLHLWHIDNFVNGMCLSLHWDIDNLVDELHLRDFNSFLHLLNHKNLALYYHRSICHLLLTELSDGMSITRSRSSALK